MTRKGNITRIFPGSNTRYGFFSFYDSVLANLDRIYVMKGGPGTGKSTFVKRIGLVMADRGYDIEYLCCSSDVNSLDGVIVSELKVGIVDGTAPHVIDPKYPGAVEEIINLGEFWDNSKLIPLRDEIISISNKKSASYHQAYKNLEQAYKNNSKLEEDSDLTDSQVKELVGKWAKEIFISRTPVLRQLFAGAITPEGIVHYTEEIISECERKMAITKGKVQDKSRFIHQLALTALENGYNVDLYHCFFNPDRHIMVLIPELKTVILDNYISHIGEIVSEKDITEVIKIGEDNPKPGKELFQQLNKSISLLKEAKKNHEMLEKHYTQAMDYGGVDKIREKILTQIFNIANKRK